MTDGTCCRGERVARIMSMKHKNIDMCGRDDHVEKEKQVLNIAIAVVFALLSASCVMQATTATDPTVGVMSWSFAGLWAFAAYAYATRKRKSKRDLEG